MWDYRAKVISVHDGDTVRVLLDKGHYDYREISLRLDGVRAPELKQEGGPETRDYLAGLLDEAAKAGGDWPLVVVSRRIANGSKDTESAGRFVGTLYLPGNPFSLNDRVNIFVTEHGYPRGY